MSDERRGSHCAIQLMLSQSVLDDSRVIGLGMALGEILRHSGLFKDAKGIVLAHQNFSLNPKQESIAPSTMPRQVINIFLSQIDDCPPENIRPEIPEINQVDGIKKEFSLNDLLGGDDDNDRGGS